MEVIDSSKGIREAQKELKMERTERMRGSNARGRVMTDVQSESEVAVNIFDLDVAAFFTTALQ